MKREIEETNLMETETYWPWELPPKLEGPAVMFDVVSASTNIANLVGRARQLYLVTKENVETAVEAIPEALLIGETDDENLRKKLETRFVATNSTAEIIRASVEGKDVILITNNGTHTVSELLATGADPVAVGSFVNLRACADWILKHKHWQNVTLVPSGGREIFFAANPRLPEDFTCAKAMEDLLLGKQQDLGQIIEAAKELMKLPYKDKYPAPENIAIIFQAKDTFPVVPVCKRLASGLVQVTNALRS